MRLYVGFLLVLAAIFMLALITCADSSGKSRNREDRFDLEIERFNNQESDKLMASCESTESVEANSCQGKQKSHKRKSFKFAV
ncbi:uncharacterized protein LOC26526236 [Drosophila erecta]|uniref:Uncharacterized protein n=1 Tax=Drosophila erecta TaxID=7220 RepID=A0A0Q5UJ94_DROER|nr:uncharacterized protein LOC26526236 [Drosophila erecta]KQS43978.1 uncharacterized protein Dere_GG26412 [Drosophila erecta]